MPPCHTTMQSGQVPSAPHGRPAAPVTHACGIGSHFTLSHARIARYTRASDLACRRPPSALQSRTDAAGSTGQTAESRSHRVKAGKTKHRPPAPPISPQPSGTSGSLAASHPSSGSAVASGSSSPAKQQQGKQHTQHGHGRSPPMHAGSPDARTNRNNRQNRPSSRSPSSPTTDPQDRELSNRIRSATSVQQLAEVLAHHHQVLSSDNVGLCWVQLTKLQKQLNPQSQPTLTRPRSSRQSTTQHNTDTPFTTVPTQEPATPSDPRNPLTASPPALSQPQQLVDTLLNLMTPFLPTCSLYNLSMVLWSCAKLHTHAPLRPWLNKASDMVLQQLYLRGPGHQDTGVTPPALQATNPRTTSNLLYSLALLKVTTDQHRAVWEWLKAGFTPLAESANAQDLCNAAYALGVVATEPGPVWPSICAALTTQLRHRDSASQFIGQALANLAWALKQLGPGNPTIVDVLAAHLTDTPPAQLLKHPIEAANVVWAAACLGMDDSKGWFSERADRVAHLVPDMDSQLLSMALWAYATADVRSDVLLAAATDTLTRRAPWTLLHKPQALIHILWSLAKLECFNPQLFMSLQPVARSNMEHMTVVEQQMLLWSLAKFVDASNNGSPLRYLELVDHQLAGSLVQRLAATLDTCTAHELGTICASLAMLTWYDPRVNQKVLLRLSQGLDEFSLPQMSTLLWWMAKVVCVEDPEVPDQQNYQQLVTQVRGLLCTRIQELALQTQVQTSVQVKELTRSLWCCAVMDPCNLEVISTLFKVLAPAFQRPTLVDWCMVAQALHAVCQLSQATDEQLTWMHQEPVKSMITRAVSLYQDVAADVTPSATQLQVHAELQHVPGVQSTQMEVPVAEGMIRVDVMIRYQGRDIAMEVDGPFHYAINRQDVTTGDTRFRNRLLESHGFQLVCLRASEFMDSGTVQQRTQMLKELLQLAVDDPEGLRLRQQKGGQRLRSPELSLPGTERSPSESGTLDRPWKTVGLDTQRKMAVAKGQVDAVGVRKLTTAHTSASKSSVEILQPPRRGGPVLTTDNGARGAGRQTRGRRDANELAVAGADAAGTGSGASKEAGDAPEQGVGGPQGGVQGEGLAKGPRDRCSEERDPAVLEALEAVSFAGSRAYARTVRKKYRQRTRTGSTSPDVGRIS